MTPETVKQVIEDTIKVRELAQDYLSMTHRDQVTGTLCLGSGCLMWRWLPDGAVVNGQFAPFGSLSSTHGECGLSRAAQ